MTTTYPYYTSTKVDCGVLRKLFNEKKFKCMTDATKATRQYYRRLEKIYNKNFLLEVQIAVIEYEDCCKSKIVGIMTNGEFELICKPLKL